MKRIVTILLALTMIIAMFTGCGSSKDGITVNKAYSSKEMQTITGNKVTFDDNTKILASKTMGFACLYPNEWKNADENKLDIMVTENEIYVGYIPQAVLDEVMNINAENMTEEEAMKKYTELFEKTFKFICIYKVVEGDADSETLKDDMNAKYENIKELVKNGEAIYYIAYNTTIPATDFNENDKKESQALIDGVEELHDNIILFPIEDLNAEFKGNLNNFSTLDTEGNTVTQDIFADYDITMVNIWTTWCGFCVDEMPELAKMYKDLPSNVNLISICGDAADEPELTKEIMKKSGVTFTTLEQNDEINDALTQYVSGYPTTIFVDSKGNVVGDTQVGAPGDDVIAGYTELINNALAAIGK